MDISMRMATTKTYTMMATTITYTLVEVMVARSCKIEFNELSMDNAQLAFDNEGLARENFQMRSMITFLLDSIPVTYYCSHPPPHSLT